MKSFAFPVLSLILLSWSEVAASTNRIDEDRVILEMRLTEEAAVDQALFDLENPSSPEHGKPLSLEVIKRRFGPQSKDLQKVTRFLKQRGFKTRVDPSGLFVNGVGDASKLINSESPISTGLQPKKSPSAIVPIPEALKNAVATIRLDPIQKTGALLEASQVSLARSRPHRTALFRTKSQATYSSMLPNTGTPSGCPEALETGALTPNQWLEAYQLSRLHADGFKGQGRRIAVMEYLGQWITPADVTSYSRCFGIPSPKVTLNTYSGQPGPTASNAEAAGDVAVLLSAAPQSQIDLWYYDGLSTLPSVMFAESLTRATFGQNPKRRPDVISISYNYCEAQLAVYDGVYNSTGDFSPHNGLSPEEVTRIPERVLKRLALAGIAVFNSTGDQGASGCRQTVTFPDGSGSFGSASHLVNAMYPATSPWITAVGATNLALSKDNQILEEIVWNDNSVGLYFDYVQYGVNPEPYWLDGIAASVGGRSALFKAPTWQKPFADEFKLNARMVPDLSAFGDAVPGYVFPVNGVWSVVGGTSLSTPLVAGGFTLLKQALWETRKKKLGLINPLIYRMAANPDTQGAFHDVTLGNNDTGDQILFVSQDFSPSNSVFRYPAFGLYAAKPGYDMASGLGSIRFADFLENLLRDH